MLNTPVLFLIFKRLDTTMQVLEQIREAKPKKLYIAADGPRDEVAGEAEECEKLRKAVLDRIDWDCEIVKLFREQNITAKIAISEAIDWFFEHEEEGIILEDDCVPDPTFFSFCEHLLEKYRDDSRVLHISGCNLQFGQTYGDGSYYFSKHVNIWGWATWRRAWKHYDITMKSFPQFQEQNQMYNIMDKMHARYTRRFAGVYDTQGGRHEWAYQWAYANLSQGGLAITPNKNLISNIGFGGSAETTLDSQNPLANLPTEAIEDIQHPMFMLPFREADERFVKLTAARPSFFQQLRVFFKKHGNFGLGKKK